MNNLRNIRVLIIFTFIIGCFSSAYADVNIKTPNVSGQFYDSDVKRLTVQVDQFLNQADISPYDSHIDVVISPHAGYIYSGGVAAYSFKAVSQQKYSTIIILAPSHYFGFDGISIWNRGGFQTPFGEVPIDGVFADQLIASNEKIYFKPEFFAKEHSIEVEIPFIQKTFPNANIVPVLFGQTSFDLLKTFSMALDKIIAKRTDVLVVVSTDLSHYHTDSQARTMDAQAIEAIKNLDAQKIYKECKERTIQMCGCIPVVASVLFSKLRNLNNVDLLKYANSGDVSGDKNRVVGYSSIVMYSDKKESTVYKTELSLTVVQKSELMNIAQNTLKEYLNNGTIPKVHVEDVRLEQREGAFVSIYNKEKLRGCIGNIIGTKPLFQTIQNMTIASASQDKRFTSVQKQELSEISLEISVLSAPRVIKDVSEIILGEHGVIVSKGSRQGVFLPQVAESTGWNKEFFLSELCSQKAGLPRDCWKDSTVKMEVFTADVFNESDL